MRLRDASRTGLRLLMICGGIGAGFRGTAQVMAKGHDDSKGSSVCGSMYMARELHTHTMS